MVSNTWTQGTFYIQVIIDGEISGVLRKNNNKTKQTDNLASSHYITVKQLRKSNCLRQEAWLNLTIIKHLVQLSILTKRRTCTKGGVWVCFSMNFLEKLPNVSDKQVSQKRHFGKFTDPWHWGWWVPLECASPIARLGLHLLASALLIGSRFIRENWKVI